LHFSRGLLSDLKKRGHGFASLTLHINYGTFKPVESVDITQHPMHWEEYKITPSVHARICRAKEQGRRIVAVGTTSCRVLETVAKGGSLTGSTNLFIYPGFSFRMVDALITNFHLPFSTLLMLVNAFGGMDLIKRAYQEAIREKYRFYSYGDAMLII
jgi:S-adenosylmethionine:tRNA ribosyltransferase-isomerase